MKFLFLNYRFFIPFLMITLLLVGCDDDDAVDVIDEPVSIAEELDQDPDFTILTAALHKAGLYDTLTQGDFTVFAPDNAAFIAAGITNLDRFTAEYLENLLLYHVISSELTYNDLDSGALETLNGEIYLDGVDRRPFINGDAEFIQINFEATNGIIHVIDEVLFPPEQSVVGFIEEEPNLSILQEAIGQAGLEETLNGDGPFTFFAPTDLAFEALFSTLEISGLDELSGEELRDILAYHVVQDRFFSSALEEKSYNTLAEEELEVFFHNFVVLSDNHEETENAIIVNGNSLATNGVVHKIDRVMLPTE